jgi:hypothetical protein
MPYIIMKLIDMLNYLRKKRKTLIAKGNLKNYLAFASGEILLVMVGILLALQVNNWNENRKMKNEEIKYLLRIYSDLEIDSTYFSERIIQSNQEILNYYRFIHESYNEVKTKEEYAALIQLTWFGSEHLTIQNSTFLEMINAGKLDLIRNDSLKTAINKLYTRYEAVGKHLKEFNEYSVSLLTEWARLIKDSRYRPQNIDLFDEPFMFEADDWQWINDYHSHEFKYAQETISLYSVKHKVFISYFDQLMDEISEIRNTIRDELDE